MGGIAAVLTVTMAEPFSGTSTPPQTVGGASCIVGRPCELAMVASSPPAAMERVVSMSCTRDDALGLAMVRARGDPSDAAAAPPAAPPKSSIKYFFAIVSNPSWKRFATCEVVDER